MVQSRILIVDDEPRMLEVCLDTLSKLTETEVVVEEQSIKAADMLASEPWDLLIADIRMPEINGVELVKKAKEKNPELLVLMLTAFPSIDTAVESMKLGANDYLTKPVKPDDLRNKVRRLLEEKRIREENRLLRRQVGHDYRMGEMIGQSRPMQHVFDTIERIAPTNIDVLIIGETGTGKELAARNIHRKSSRKDQQFVPVDCGAIPEDLIESELFGHERGAFTGADTRSIGLLEFAHNGTFFLDEVGQLSPKLQAKLLRVLQERKFRRVGGTQEIKTDVRIIAATSLDLDKEVEEKRFRTDLYYRINVARLDLPPLRERGEDIAILSSHFMEQYATKMGKSDMSIHPETLEILKSYHWPGNVRQLDNVVKRTLVMTQNKQIIPANLPDEIIATSGDWPDAQNAEFFKLRDREVARFERQYLGELLELTGGDVTQAAERAKVPRGTFYRLLKRNNMDPEEYRN